MKASENFEIGKPYSGLTEENNLNSPKSSLIQNRKLPEIKDLNLSEKEPELFHRMVNDNLKTHRVEVSRVAEGMDCLNKIETDNLQGNKLSYQEFTYTEKGLPAVNYNYLYSSNGTPTLYSHFAYTYDNMGRVTSAEEIFADRQMWDQNIRYEYTYSGESDQYASRTLFEVYGEDIYPVTKEEYSYDEYGYPACRISYYWDGMSNDFIPTEKIEYGYTPEGIGNKAFFYVWDRAANKWVGNTYGAYFSQTAIIDDQNRVTELITYTWENDDWLAFWKQNTNYNQAGNIKTLEHAYWNGTDWNGPYVNRNGFPSYNVWATYEYDSDNRETLVTIEQANKNGGKDLVREDHSIYENLEDGIVSRFSYPVSYNGQTASYSSYTLTHAKPSGILTFSQSGTFDGENTYPYSEEVFKSNENDLNFESIYYLYKDGVRLNDMREVTDYGDDWDGIENHPVFQALYDGDGTGDEDGWLPYIERNYKWENDVVTEYDIAIYERGFRIPTASAEYEFDFNVPASQLLTWNLIYDEDFFGWDLYKELSCTKYLGNDRGDWDLARSTCETYHYSPFTSSVKETFIEEDAAITDIYDISGRRLNSLAKGVNIVRYSNGKCDKILVK